MHEFVMVTEISILVKCKKTTDFNNINAKGMTWFCRTFFESIEKGVRINLLFGQYPSTLSYPSSL